MKNQMLKDQFNQMLEMQKKQKGGNKYASIKVTSSNESNDLFGKD